MLSYDILPLGAYQTNCYILKSGGKALVIDPGYEPDTIADYLRRENLTLEAILLTHGHFDHVGAVKKLVEVTGCRLWMHQADYTQVQSPQSDFFYPLHDCNFTEVWFCEEGEEICVGDLVLQVLETPGHTWGSVCYLCQNVLFSGDTLFAGSCGRTDLPGGDWATIQASLRRLAQIEADFTVCPGHGETTTLAREKASNPYLRGSEDSI